MKTIKDFMNYVIENILIMLLNLALVCAISQILVYSLPLVHIILMVIIIHCIMALLRYNKHTIFLALFIGFIYISYALLTKESQGYNLYYYMKQFIGAVAYGAKEQTFPMYYQGTMLAIITFITANLFYIWEMKFKGIYAQALFPIYLCIYIIPHFLGLRFSPSTFLLMWVCLLTYYINKHYLLKPNLVTKFSTLGISLCLCFVLVSLTRGFTVAYPNSLDFIDDVYNKIQDYLDGRGPIKVNSIEQIQGTNFDAFENNDETLVMTLNSKTPRYLIGYVYNEYGNGQWKSDESTSPTLFETAPVNNQKYNLTLLRGLADQGTTNTTMGLSLNDLYESHSVNITYNNLYTYAVYTPYGLTKIIPQEEGLQVLSASGALLTSDLLKPGTNFTVDYELLDIENPFFHNLLQQSYVGLEEDLLNKGYQVRSTGYLEENLDIPESMLDLKNKVLHITEGYGNNYDKVRALEKYLATEFTYTLNVDPIPEGTDAVHYFLNESQKGYCTYYASAMALMARHLGLPSRYVTGYRIPTPPRTGALMEEAMDEALGKTSIRQLHAHAWTEIYFEGFGWMHFEPTAPYFVEYDALLGEDYQEIQLNKELEATTTPESIEDELPQKTDSKTGLILWIVILLSFPGYKLIRYLIYCGLDYNKKAIIEYNAILRVFAIMGQPIKKHETPMAYCIRLREHYLYRDKHFIKSTKTYEKARYCSKPVTKEEYEAIKAYKKYIHKQAKVDHPFLIMTFYL